MPFAEQCIRLGFSIKKLPTLCIEPLPQIQSLDSHLENTDVILFTSQNAVTHLHRQTPLPRPDQQVHAIGPATKAALNQLNQTVHLEPAAPFTSESYLNHLASFPPQRILIVKGEGGRDLIENQLSEQGWEVHTADVYRRSIPAYQPDDIAAALKNPPPDIISITSDQSLENLVNLAKDYWAELRHLPMVVNSVRCQQLALSLGFTQIPMVAVPAGNQGQLHQLQQWLASR